jgi:hypothetical protein
VSVVDPQLHAGAAPVGRLAEAHPADRLLVAALRLWLDAPEGRGRAATLLALDLGAERAERSVSAMERFLEAVANGATRRLWRSRPGCAGLGRDEAALAELARLAAAGPLERAYGAAAALVRPAALFETVETAAHLGRALRAPARPAAADPDAPPP